MNGQEFKTVEFLYDCLLKDQVVVDEASEILKLNRKNKIDDFMDGCEEIMMERGHCNDQGKLDVSMKAHFRRFSCTLRL